MAGVPWFSVDSYLSRLLKANILVAIAEQSTDVPSKGSKIIERKVTRLITPGTLIEDSLLNPKTNNYLAAISQPNPQSSVIAIAHVDISTGEFYVTACTTASLAHHIARIQPSEVLVTDHMYTQFSGILRGMRITIRESASFSQQPLEDAFSHDNAAVTLRFNRAEIEAANALLDYIRATHGSSLPRLSLPQRQAAKQYMNIDAVTRRSLELTNSIANPSSRKNTLLNCLDETVTAQGARLLASRLSLPLLDVQRINRRLDLVEYFTRDLSSIDDIRRVLRDCSDVERCVQRVSLEKASPRDLHMIAQTIDHASKLHQIITTRHSTGQADTTLPSYL